MTDIPTDEIVSAGRTSVACACLRFVLPVLLLCSHAVPAAETNDPIRLGETAFAPLREARDGSYDFKLKLKPAEGKPQFDKVDLVFAHADDASYCRFSWDAKGWRLTQALRGEAPREVGHKEALPTTLRDGGTLVIKSRPNRVEITADGRRVVRTSAHGVGAGKAGVATGAGHPAVGSARCQRVAPILFGEDFGRQPDETEDFGVWEPLYGNWELHSVIEEIQSIPELQRRLKEGSFDRNANPFSLSACADSSNATDEALIITGYPFWDDYDAAVSARTSGGGIGLAFGIRDEENLWFIRWRITTRGASPAPLELVKRVEGKDTVVSKAVVPACTENWYRLSVSAVGSLATVRIDGTVVASARDRDLTGGCVGLMAWGDGPASFDDVDVRSASGTRFDLAEPASVFDEMAAGKWAVSGELGNRAFAGRSDPAAEPALRFLGSRRWAPTSVEARVELTKATVEAGLVFAGTANGRRWELTWKQADGGRLVLSRTTNNVPLEVAAVPCPTVAPGSHHLKVDLREKGVVKGYFNGELELLATVTNDLSGRVGLLAVSPDDVRFSEVWMDRVTQRDWERPVKVGVFADDPYMQGWASPRHAWIPVESGGTNGTCIYRHKGDFYGAFSVRGPLTDRLSFLFGRDDVEKGKGYEVCFAFGGDNGDTTARLLRDGKVLHEARFHRGDREVIAGEQVIDEKLGPMPLPAETVSYGSWGVQREGRYIRVEACGRELFAHREREPLWGRELGMAVSESLDLGRVEVRRDKVKDYQFERAPVDWLPVGEWKVTNRFSCDPRWSHMNGRSRGVAALWNKLAFAGDYTVEYYAGMRMRQGHMLDVSSMYYPRVGDINVALCADGGNLFSGYNLIIAAWDKWWSERWSQFRRLGSVVAKTDRELVPRTRDRKPVERPIEEEWDPGGRPVHGAWYFVKVRKTGKRFDVWFDNTPVFSFEDKETLPGKRLALWTQDNSIVLARARIAYRSKPLAATTVSPPKAAPETKVPSAAAPVPETIACPTHPGRHFDFEQGLDGWTAAENDQGAGVARVAGGPKGGKHVLRVTNVHSGGDFRAVVPLPPLDAGRVDHLAFDCAIPPGVRVNLYLQLKGIPHERYYITLSGPDAETGSSVRLGRFEGFKADGSWQRVSFNLGRALRRRFPRRKRFTLEEMAFAYLHGDYLNAGLGGNRAGAAYELDNLSVASIGPPEVQLTRSEPGGETALVFNVLPHADITGKGVQPWQGATNTVALPKPGLWFVNVFAGAEGKRTRAASIPVQTDKPLTVVATSPADGKPWSGGPVEVRFASDTAAALIAPELSLTVGGKAVPKAVLCDALNAEHSALRLPPDVLRTEFGDGEEVAFELAYSSTVSSASKAWSSRMDLSGDRTPPGPVVLDDPAAFYLDFEPCRTRLTTSSSKSTVRVEPVPRGDVDGNRALAVFNRLCGGSLACDLGVRKFNAGRTPVLAFDYRVIPEARVDLVAKADSVSYYFGLNDVSSDAEDKTGVIPGVKADGSWQHAELNLASMIAPRLKKVSASAYDIDGLGFADWDHHASPPGAWYAVDNVRGVPVVSSRGGVRLSWHANDPGGVAGYSYCWSSNAREQVDTTVDCIEGSGVFTNLAEGELYFHVRARDRAGNWGPVAHHRILVDNTSVAIERMEPSGKSAGASESITVAFGDSLSQLDIGEARLTLNGSACPLASPHATIDVANRKLTWDWVEAAPRMTEPIPDGHEMTAHLSGLRDFAGNPSPPVEWQWRIDHASDTNGPPPPELTCWTQHTVQYDDFSEGVGGWRAYTGDGDDRTVVDTPVDPDSGSSCLRITKKAWTRRFGAYGFRGTLSPKRYDYIAFDYKIPKGVAIDLLVYVDAKWFAVNLTGEPSATLLGKVDNVRDDNKWHHALIDLPAMLEKAIPDEDKKAHLVRYLLLGNSRLNGNPVGASFRIDNFAILEAGSALPELHCGARDATGIRGFAYAMDQTPWSEPKTDKPSTASRLALPAIDKAGLWYIHVRAQDGAGNWGRTRHYPYYCSSAIVPDGEEGLEASGQWNAAKEGIRTLCELHKARSASGTNQVLALELRTWKADTIRLQRVGATQVSAKPGMLADLYNQGRTALEIAAYVRVGEKDEIVAGPPVELPPGEWVRGASLKLDLTGQGDAPHSCHEQGLLLRAPHRARSSVVIDRIVEQGT